MIQTKYTSFDTEQLMHEKKYLVDSVFKLLPYKENNYEFLNEYFESILFRLGGLNRLFPNDSYILNVMSILEAAKNENDFKMYRKAILDACTLINLILKEDI